MSEESFSCVHVKNIYQDKKAAIIHSEYRELLCYFHFCLPSRLASNIFKVIEGWMDDAIFVIFNSISVISRRWLGDNKRLEPRLRLERFPPQAELEPKTRDQ